MEFRRWYPPECFHVNEDVTRRRRKMYDSYCDRLSAECLRIDPQYYSLPLRRQIAIREQARQKVGDFVCW